MKVRWMAPSFFLFSFLPSGQFLLKGPQLYTDETHHGKDE
jgi:hypothetical protein